LRREGVYGPLDTLPDSNSAVLWASIYTGLAPAQHGILDFYRVHLAGLSTGLYPVHRTFFKEAAELLERIGLAHRVAIARKDLAVSPVWEVADWAGLTVGVVDGYLYSFPAFAPRTEGGYFLANALEVFAGGLITGQSSANDLGLYVQPENVLVHKELPRGADFEWQARATLDLLRARPQPRLLSFYCHEPDTVQHQHWRGFEPWRYFGAEDEVDAMGGPITEMHRRFDAFLADLLETLDPDTALFVISDHGHSPTLLHAMDTQHRHGPPGVFLFYGGPIREGYRYTPRPVHIYDVMPTVLYLLGLPVARDMPGRVLEEALDADLTARRPVRHISSYRPLVPPPATVAGRDERANEAEIEKLRRLGYVW
ncbi:MAG TPA: alkaline phosphatase family protein, partial [Thermoanaerobaculia bacterium]|nr:alkaline phosphatase family protein [Thermoanaerobaculia bacterium]